MQSLVISDKAKPRIVWWCYIVGDQLFNFSIFLLQQIIKCLSFGCIHSYCCWNVLFKLLPNWTWHLHIHVLNNIPNHNKAIRDGKFLARHMPVLGNVHPIKKKCWYFFRDVISLLARVFILLIDTATQEVPMKNIWKKLSVQFLRYAIKLLHVKRRTCHKWR